MRVIWPRSIPNHLDIFAEVPLLTWVVFSMFIPVPCISNICSWPGQQTRAQTRIEQVWMQGKSWSDPVKESGKTKAVWQIMENGFTVSADRYLEHRWCPQGRFTYSAGCLTVLTPKMSPYPWSHMEECSAFPSPVQPPCATLSPGVMDGPGGGVTTFLHFSGSWCLWGFLSVRLPLSAFTHDLS